MNFSTTEAFQVALSVLLSLGGGGLIVMSLSGWLGKVWANRLMQQDMAKHNRDLEELKSKFEAVNQRLQAQLDKALHVYRIQFETEFKALTEIWAKVSAVRASIAELRPSSHIEPTAPQSREQQMSQLTTDFARFIVTFNELKHVVYDQAPFYPTSVYEELDQLIKSLQDEQISVQRSDADRFTPNWYRVGRDNRERVYESVNRISELMRQRIESLSVYRE
jgi:hypothetical protein